MKAILITFDQAHYQHIIELLDRSNCRGFTAWPQVTGRGSHDGEPHYGSHAWPSMASAIITIVDTEQKAKSLMEKLHALDLERPKLGLRAFAWNVDESI